MRFRSTGFFVRVDLTFTAQQAAAHTYMQSYIAVHSTLKMRAALLQMPAARHKLLIPELHLLQLQPPLIIRGGITRRRIVAICPNPQDHRSSSSGGCRPLVQLEKSRIAVVVCAPAASIGRRRHRRMQSWGRRRTRVGDIFAHPRAQPAGLAKLPVVVVARSRAGVRSTGGIIVRVGVGVEVPGYLGGSRLWSAFITLSASCFGFSNCNYSCCCGGGGGACSSSSRRRRSSFVVVPHHHLLLLHILISAHSCSSNNNSVMPMIRSYWSLDGASGSYT